MPTDSKDAFKKRSPVGGRMEKGSVKKNTTAVSDAHVPVYITGVFFVPDIF
jgi:hypothetical protein